LSFSHPTGSLQPKLFKSSVVNKKFNNANLIKINVMTNFLKQLLIDKIYDLSKLSTGLKNHLK